MAQTHDWPVPIAGGCGCKMLRYQLNRSPMVIHCCNCESCQRETGSAFAVNVLVEADQVELLPSARNGSTVLASNGGEAVKPKLMLMPSESGHGQLIARCPVCYVAVWSHYPGAGPWLSFIRGGTLDKTSVDGTGIKDHLKPDLYIYTEFKQPWVVYPATAEESGNVFDIFYNRKYHWTEDANARMQAMRPKTNEWIARGQPWGVLGDIVDLR